MSVMGVKRGTQMWSENKNDQAALRQGATQDAPAANTAAAGDFQKAYGDQAIGDVLNKIADPNWVDPARKVRTTGSNELDKDAFFKLMLTQMKNQDPTNPMQSHEMAAQLAQFSSLEQLNNIGTGVENLAKAQTGQGNFGALAFIGKRVTGDASKISRASGDTEHGFNFSLAQDATKSKITIKDITGKTVRVLELAALKKGANSIKWNGLTDEGLPARAGEYKFSIEATGSNGGKVYAQSSFEGRISGVDFTPQGPMVIVNGQSIRLSDVKKIEDPVLAEPFENRTSATPLSVGQSKKEFIPPAPEESVVDNLDSIPMAGDLLAKVQKEAK
ncbi:MAG: flagellar hook capping FlgD N-terminal domain-containing protein [Bdellovibrionales bacterium]|nr:flagellar hook capping FlgD N-terminal domain-containing protein [Bdellovibrionales bacterium]